MKEEKGRKEVEGGGGGDIDREKEMWRQRRVTFRRCRITEIVVLRRGKCCGWCRWWEGE